MLSKNQAAENSGWTFQNSGKIFPGFLCISVASCLNVEGTISHGNNVMVNSFRFLKHLYHGTQKELWRTDTSGWAEIMTSEQGKRLPTEKHADKGNSCSGNDSSPPGTVI